MVKVPQPPFVVRPHLSRPSPLTLPPDTCNTEASSLTFELSESAHGRLRSLLLEETRRPSLPSLPTLSAPSAPSSLVVVVLCSCSPGLSCGVLVLVLSLSTWPSPNRPPRILMSCQEKRRSRRGVDLDLGMMINTCINGRSKCTLPLYRLCKVLLIYCLL